MEEGKGFPYVACSSGDPDEPCHRSTDDASSINLFNLAAERLFGRAADEVLGQPLDILLSVPLMETDLAF